MVIFSCVRARAPGAASSIGFLADVRRMNVALTRARHAPPGTMSVARLGLVVFGLIASCYMIALRIVKNVFHQSEMCLRWDRARCPNQPEFYATNLHSRDLPSQGLYWEGLYAVYLLPDE